MTTLEHQAAELEYPTAWLLGWADVMHQAPGDDPMPRIDIVHVRCERPHRGIYGKYDPRRHAVTVYATADREDSLATLVHELAHAWAPHERGHHGPKWRAKYLELFEWLTGWQVDGQGILGVVKGTTEQSRIEAFRTKRVTTQVLAATIDIALTYKLREIKPTITTTQHPNGERVIVARLAGRTHCVEVHHHVS